MRWRDATQVRPDASLHGFPMCCKRGAIVEILVITILTVTMLAGDSVMADDAVAIRKDG